MMMMSLNNNTLETVAAAAAVVAAVVAVTVAETSRRSSMNKMQYEQFPAFKYANMADVCISPHAYLCYLEHVLVCTCTVPSSFRHTHTCCYSLHPRHLLTPRGLISAHSAFLPYHHPIKLTTHYCHINSVTTWFIPLQQQPSLSSSNYADHTTYCLINSVKTWFIPLQQQPYSYLSWRFIPLHLKPRARAVQTFH